MHFVGFAGANRVLTAPAGCEDSVDDLPVYANEHEVISCWQLDASEFVRVMQNGGRVWLRVVTNTGSQPPVLLQVDNPFEHRPGSPDVP